MRKYLPAVDTDTPDITLENLNKVKTILYDTIAMEEDTPEVPVNIEANQSMGVQVSHAMKKEKNINIIQMQSVVNKKVTTNMVSALRIIDSMQLEHLMANNLLGSADIKKLVNVLASQLIPLEDFVSDIKKLYVEAILERCTDVEHAARTLGVRQSTLQKLLKQLNISEPNMILIEDTTE